MKKALLTAALLLTLLPLSIADNLHIGYYPAITGSPAVEIPLVQGRFFSNPTPSPIREGLPVIVHGQLPVIGDQGTEGRSVPVEAQLHIDEYGVLVNHWNQPVIVGTTGRSFANGFDWTVTYPWNRYGPYFTSNLRGFKAGIAQTNKYKDDGARTYGVFIYNGFGPSLQVIKQWYRPRQDQAGYYNPGLTKMVSKVPQYVQPGLPGQPMPEESSKPAKIEATKIVEKTTEQIVPSDEDVDDLLIEE